MSEDLLALTADIVSAHVGNNIVALGDLPGLISSVHNALAATTNPPEVEKPKQEPAVSIRSSIKPDHLVSLESGKKMKMLKRYLMTNYGMTPADYRAKWGLPRDYPMVAPDYAQQRKELAVKIGLGRGGGRKPAAPAKLAAKAAPKKAVAKVAPKSAPKTAAKSPAPETKVATESTPPAALKGAKAKAVVAPGRSKGTLKAKFAARA